MDQLSKAIEQVMTCNTCLFLHLCEGFKLSYCEGKEYVKQK